MKLTRNLVSKAALKLEETHMKNALLTIAMLSSLAFALPVAAVTNDWKELSGLAFKSIDDDWNGVVTRSEYSNIGDDVFVSMDGNSSGSLSLSEFYACGFGLRDTAKMAGQAEAFNTAMRVVFALWDCDADNLITKQEYRSGFSVIVAAEAAIQTQSVSN